MKLLMNFRFLEPQLNQSMSVCVCVLGASGALIHSFIYDLFLLLLFLFCSSYLVGGFMQLEKVVNDASYQFMTGEPVPVDINVRVSITHCITGDGKTIMK